MLVDVICFQQLYTEILFWRWGKDFAFCIRLKMIVDLI
jgi:hypothetical protein